MMIYIGGRVIDGSMAGALHNLYERYVRQLESPGEAQLHYRETGLAV